MAIIKKCCCFDVRTGTQIMVSFHLVFVMADFGLTVYTCIGLQTDVLRELLAQFVGYNDEYWQNVLMVAYMLLSTYFLSMVMSAILAMYSWCTNPDFQCLLWFWLIGQGVLSVIGLGLNIAYLVMLAQPGAGLWRTYFSSAAQFVVHLIFTILTSIVLISHLQNLRKGLGKNLRIYFSSLVPRDLTAKTNHAYRTRTESNTSNIATTISHMTEVGHNANMFDMRAAPVKSP
ncbi:uncharacterized protein [Branchiostoma lanceolatum]|uniref:Hypp9046 protein n=1 Tax=Branchiostoma lanceolatum TaxID=7740 RepID=A0A8K0EFN5_BRALA|nr:Hypp9046 [Branchiostoma lanceolatum]